VWLWGWGLKFCAERRVVFCSCPFRDTSKGNPDGGRRVPLGAVSGSGSITTDGRLKTSRLVVHSWLNATELVLKSWLIALPLVRRALRVDSQADGTGQFSGSGPVEVRHIGVICRTLRRQ